MTNAHIAHVQEQSKTGTVPGALPKPLPPRIAQIIVNVCGEYRLRPAVFFSRDLSKRAVRARYDAIRRIWALEPRPSMTQIGMWFDRHHTIVVYAVYGNPRQRAA